MNPSLRNVLAVVAGLVAGFVVVMAVQTLSTEVLYPPPPGFDPSDPEQLAALMDQIPLGALLMVELSYALGSLVAGLTLAKLAASRQLVMAGVAGAVLTVAGIANLMAVPHPLWFAIVSTATYVPMALLGARLGTPREPSSG